MPPINIFILFLLFAVPAWAQEPAQQPVLAPAMGAEQWQLTFDVVKSKVDALVHENDQLTSQYQVLYDERHKLQTILDKESQENERLRRLIKEHDGRTEQQLHIAQLETQIKSKNRQLQELQKQARTIDAQAKQWQRRLDEQRAKIADWEWRHSAKAAAAAPAPAPSTQDPELTELRRELEEQKAKEADLENTLASLSKEDVDPQIRILKEKVRNLQAKKAALLAALPDKNGAIAAAAHDRARYAMMLQQKQELESRISQFAATMKTLKDPLALGISWQLQKKQLIHDIVQADARNAQMRSRINGLREDIEILKDKIRRLAPARGGLYDQSQ